MPEVSVIKAGSLVRDEQGNILDARSSVTLVTSGRRKIIVDTGLQGEDGLIVAGLEKNGLEPQDIDAVINTHAHPDHCGNNFLFTSALLLRPTDGEEIAPGVRCMATPGHSPDSISIIVKAANPVSKQAAEFHTTDSLEIKPHETRFPEKDCRAPKLHMGVIVIAGDALPTLNNFLKGVPPALHTNRDLAVSSMKMIIEIADVVVPGHDSPFSLAEGKYIQPGD